jgi:hypothetical protein
MDFKAPKEYHFDWNGMASCDRRFFYPRTHSISVSKEGKLVITTPFVPICDGVSVEELEREMVAFVRAYKPEIRDVQK